MLQLKDVVLDHLSVPAACPEVQVLDWPLDWEVGCQVDSLWDMLLEVL